VPVSRHPAQAVVRSTQYGVGRPRVRSPRCWSWRLTCPLVLASSSSSPLGSPDRVSALSGRATGARIRSVIRGHQLEGAGQPVAVSCRLSATGVRFSVIRFPPGSSALQTVGLPAGRPDLDGVTAFRTREQRPGWVPSIPRGQRCSPGPIALTGPRLPHHSGVSLYPAPAHPTRRGFCFTRHQRGFKQFTRPVFPSPATARVERALLWAFPRASYPADQEPDDARRVRTGHRARTRNNAYDISRTSNPA
jgi:hypothetical protein